MPDMSQTPPPLRVQPIEYQMPPGRPAALTAVGVISIVIASIGTLLGCVGIASMLAFGFSGARSSRLLPPPPAATQASIQTQTISTSSGAATVTVYPMAPRPEIAFNRAVSLCNFVLAIFLLICGILVLKDSRRGRTTHLVYASIKIPLTVAEICISLWMLKWFVSASPMAGMFRVIIIISLSMQGVFGCAYPIALLIIMTRKSVAQYYQTQLK
jgi:hypothetical protein